MLLKRSLRQPSRPKAISRIVSLVLAGGFLYLLVSTRIPVSQAEPTPFLKPESASLLPQDPPSLQTLRNVGKAYYEQGKYDEAIARFEKITALGRSKAEDHLNLGLALMQNQQLDAAMGELTTARRMAPRSTAVLYNLGILHKRLLRYPDAEALLQQVVEADPEDPAAWFNLAKVRFDQRKLPEALESYSRVVNMGFGKGQNFYVASLFHSFTALMRLKRREEAMKLFQTHQSVKDKVPSIALQMPALEGGRYGAIHVPPPEPEAPSSRSAPQTLAFTDVTARMTIFPSGTLSAGNSSQTLEISNDKETLASLGKRIATLWQPSIVVADFDSDTRPDLFLVNPAGRSRLFRNDGAGGFSDVTAEAGIGNLEATLGAAFADFDNSGQMSLLVVGAKGVKLFQRGEGGGFTDISRKAGLAAHSQEVISSAVFFDSDNDGLLDLFLTGFADLSRVPAKQPLRFPQDFAAGVNHFYRNNGDGTFTQQTQEAGFSSERAHNRNVTLSDFNNDLTIDLVISRDGRSPAIFLGQGESKFRDHTPRAGTAVNRTESRAATTADFNHDGNLDLLLWTTGSPRLLLNDGSGNFTPMPDPSRLLASRGGPVRGTVADLNADGSDDLVLVDSKGARILVNDSGRGFRPAAHDLPNSGPRALAATLGAAPLRDWGHVNLLALDREGTLRVYETRGRPGRWLQIGLSGSKSNLAGVGAVVEVKAGNFYRKVLVTGGPLRLFTGNREKLDVVRLTWPNLIIQNRIEVTADQSLDMRESERLASSCPFLYVWDGERYVFLTDVLGVAPLGEYLPDGSTITPNPQEYVRIPGDVMRQQNGRYVLQLTNELREADFFDRVRLYAVDHPQEEEIYADERYSSPPFPSPSLHRVGRKHFPVSARDHHGHDLLGRLLSVDGSYAGDFKRHRITGVAELHTLTLDPGRITPSGNLKLFLTGWVLWTNSDGSRALSTNREVEIIPPALQVKDEAGEWVTVIDDLGLPSGTNRTMVVDLSEKFLSEDRSVRIATNLCVYWDQAFFSTEKEGIHVKKRELPLLSADLHYRGFSTPVNDPLYRRPDDFDYQRLLVNAPWNPHVGLYTRYGDVKELLSRTDDKFTVMSVGDELTVEFDASRLPTLPPGWKRDFILHAHGWAKPGEPNAGFGRTVEPLPFLSMSAYPYGQGEEPPSGPDYQDYLRTYQTRHSRPLIPPLAPYRSRP